MKLQTPEEIKAITDKATAVSLDATTNPGVPYNPANKAITSEQLQPASPVNLGTYTPPQNPLLTPIDTALKEPAKLGATEQGAQDISSQMLALTGSLTGKEAFRGEQEQLAGLGALEATQKDLTSQYNALVNETNAIPLQIQQESMGKGLTAGGIAPIQTARLRENSIKALTVNSLLQSTQGNISNARATADRAVQLKYGDDEAKLNYLTKAYDIITKSPQYTAEQKKRATEEALLLDDRKRLLDDKKEDEKAIFGMASLAIKNNPNDPTAQMKAQQAIESGDLRTAFSLLGQYQDNPQEVADMLLTQEYKREQINNLIADRALTNAQKAKVINESIPVQSPKESLQQNEALTLVKELLKSDAVGKKSALGASFSKIIPFAQGAGLQPDRTAFESRVETLKSNLTLDNLKLLKGAMSDKDLLFLNSIGSSLNTNMSETEFDKELRRIETKLENAGATGVKINSSANALLSKYGL